MSHWQSGPQGTSRHGRAGPGFLMAIGLAAMAGEVVFDEHIVSSDRDMSCETARIV